MDLRFGTRAKYPRSLANRNDHSLNICDGGSIHCPCAGIKVHALLFSMWAVSSNTRLMNVLPTAYALSDTFGIVTLSAPAVDPPTMP